MRAALRTFLDNESGATTVDWVVLAAATVGIGISAAAAVRSGTGSLATDIQTALGNASVAMVCQDEGGGYELAYLTGDRSGDARSVSDQISRMSDQDLLAAYAETVEKTNILNDAGEDPAYVGEVLDYAYLYAQEIASRRLETPEGVQNFDALNSAINGSGGSACGSGGSAGNADYALQLMDDAWAAEFSAELARMDSGQMSEMVRALTEEYRNTASNRDREGMQKALDHLYLTYQALVAHGRAPEAIAAAQDAFESLRDDYNSRYA